MKIKLTERGWPGNLLIGKYCLFRRNTLCEWDGVKVVIATVGRMIDFSKGEPLKQNSDCYYETQAYLSDNSEYDDPDSSKKVFLDCKTRINEPIADIEANLMHEDAVKFVKNKLKEHMLKCYDTDKCETFNI